MSALLFPGQGSQAVGMGSELYKNFDIVKKIFAEADEKLGYSISKLILEGPEDQLQLTKNTQPAILTVSYSIYKVLKDEFNFDFSSFKYFAGHSLGEYSALVCSESLSFDDALYLLHERGKAMQEAVPVGKGSMIAVLGLKTEDFDGLLNSLDKKKGVCEIANDNAAGQIIISGNKDSVSSLQVLLKEKKIKSIPLKVSAPFHCSLMKPASVKMQDKINNTKFHNPLFEIINNVTATPENDSSKIKKLLIEQIFSTVKWRQSILNMSEKGVQNFIEIGPGKVLTGMVKRTVKEANCFSINSIADIKNLIDEFKNRKVLITGATGGIGNSLVEKFSDLGSTVMATGTNEVKLNNLKKFPNILIEKFKLDEHDKIESFIELVNEKLNGIDILVNNAGITLDNLSIRLTEENWKKVLDINLTSSFLMCKYTIKKMLKKYGKIVNITSIVGHTGNLGQANYAASKAGIVAFSKSLASEYAKKNININCVSPGFIKTDMTDKINEDFKKTLIGKIPSGDLGSGEDVSNCVAFLASDMAKYINGETIHVNGGMYMA